MQTNRKIISGGRGPNKNKHEIKATGQLESQRGRKGNIHTHTHIHTQTNNRMLEKDNIPVSNVTGKTAGNKERKKQTNKQKHTHTHTHTHTQNLDESKTKIRGSNKRTRIG